MIVERLRQIQDRDKLSDGAIAAKLGLHRVTWCRLKHGRIAPTGIKFLRGVRKAYPQLSPEIDGLLLDDSLNDTNVFTDCYMRGGTDLPIPTLKSRSQRPFRGLHRVLVNIRRNWRFYIGI